jgi:hypothetical protein
MNKNDLTETVEKSLKELGFARVSRAAIHDIFSSGDSTAPFETNDALKDFAAGHNLEISEDGDFVVFEPKGGE